MIDSESKSWWKKASDHNEKGEFAQALLAIDYFLLMNPNDLRGHAEKSSILCEMEAFAEAAELLSAFSPDPQEKQDVISAYYTIMGDVAREIEAYDVALEAYDKAISIRPDHSSGYIFKGCLLAFLGRLEEAKALHRTASDLEGDPDEAYLNLGLIYRAEERFEEAIEALEKALELSPDYKSAKHILADVQKAMTLENRIRAIRAAGSMSEDWWATALECYKQGSQAQAKKAIDQYLYENPENFFGPILKSMILRSVADVAGAGEALAIIDPDSQEDLRFRARFYIESGLLAERRGDKDAALDAYDKAISISPGRSSGYFRKGELLTFLGRIEEAISCYQAAAENAEDAGLAYLNIAYIHRAKGHYREAIEALEKELEISPNLEEALDCLEDLRNAIVLQKEIAALVAARKVE